jgi:uncharacterized spore protein YtfJ
MEPNFQETIDKILEEIKSLAKTETVIGDPFQLGEFTCVPVIKIGLGLASGVGGGSEPKKGQGSGGGAGGGIGISPIAFLVTKGDEISVLSLDKKKGLAGIFEQVPDLMEKYIDLKGKKEKE